MSLLKLPEINKMNVEMFETLFKDVYHRVEDTYGLLNNLLQWTKSQMKGITPNPTYFDIQEDIEIVIDSLQDIANTKKITIKKQIEKQKVFADKDMFAVVSRNLIMNAIKYSVDGSDITISSELIDNMVVISIKDAGIGVPEEIQERLFKLSETKSQRGTHNESGTGLGLVLCADFVKLNGGKIWFTSKKEEGSTFYFSAPTEEKLSKT
jgi:two-component system sensor histidine kinase/response regulator